MKNDEKKMKLCSIMDLATKFQLLTLTFDNQKIQLTLFGTYVSFMLQYQRI